MVTMNDTEEYIFILYAGEARKSGRTVKVGILDAACQRIQIGNHWNITRAGQT